MTTPQRIAPFTARQMMNKVPEVTAIFWIIKVLATTVGETAADYLNVTLNFGMTGVSLVVAALLLAALALQFRLRRFVPAVYWLAIVLISVVGTLITDNLIGIGLPLVATTIIFALALTATFILWFRSERTLSIHSITTTRRETYYWLTVLFTFALGTATGDLLAEGLKLGYFASLMLFAGAIVAVSIAYFVFSLNAVLAFWIAYVLTRPLGASTGDLLAQSPVDGGLGLGTTLTSIIFLAVILTLVTVLTVRQRLTKSIPSASQQDK
ncbi:hypothetical protein [Frigoribacterium sp. CG_9.8]|uniref:COG4705 family protein n=1 Tax=Frigoribacterium sp. CG_9.8 TaxID=2787733 RepID=UPI001A2BF7A9|nr:hypothetical protein [Frigoribacterium sp. CG_9.8]MBG6108626.1 putative membrane-anchored protein [Frigoribacterium sp. CG_9.8]